MMSMLQCLLSLLFIKPLVFVLLGLNVRRRALLPRQGPCVVVANHNSHLDTLVLFSLFPLHMLKNIHAVAGVDYFRKNKLLYWTARNLFNMIGIDRQNPTGMQLGINSAKQALQDGKILIFYPEGTRGAPEKRSPMKLGLSHIISSCPQVAVIPVFMHGLGMALPKGEALLVPFMVDVFVGEPIYWQGSKLQFATDLQQSFDRLEQEGHFACWQ